MRRRALLLLLLVIPAVLVPGGLVGSYCAALCCIDAAEASDSCCGGPEDGDGLAISEIPSCCLDDVTWVTPAPPDGTAPECRLDFDVDGHRPSPTLETCSAPAEGRRFDVPSLPLPPDLPDRSRTLPLLI